MLELPTASLPLDPLERNRSVPRLPLGCSSAVQYALPAVRFSAVIAHVFHAAAFGAAITQRPSSDDGRPDVSR